MAAAARGGGRTVPAAAEQDDRGMGRCDGEGGSAASGRAAVASRLARGRRAACASGEQGLRGGAEALQRRQGRNRKGNGSGSMSGSQRNSPGLDWSGGRSEGGRRWRGRGFDGDGDGGRWRRGRFGPAEGRSSSEKGRRRRGVRWGGLGRGESTRGGEDGRRKRRRWLCSSSAQPTRVRKEKGRKNGHGSGERDKDASARRARIDAGRRVATRTSSSAVNCPKQGSHR